MGICFSSSNIREIVRIWEGFGGRGVAFSGWIDDGCLIGLSNLNYSPLLKELR